MVSYDQLMTVIILKEISIMGKEVALKEARAVPGIKVNDQGNVTGGSKAKLKSLIDVFKELSGGMAVVFAKKAIEPLLTGDEDLPEELAGKQESGKLFGEKKKKWLERMRTRRS